AWERATAALCGAAHAEGRHVHVSGLAEPPDRELVAYLAALGIDSVEADDPGLLIYALAAAGLHPLRPATVGG
ncbi:MAG TPA: hypothetical protein VIM50_05080, partial [Candidatus Limnocylindria bacterium]